MPDFSTLRILIVDDHEIIRHGLVQALTAHGALEISEAHSFHSSISQLASGSFDLIIVDQNLGDGDGIDLSISISLYQPSATTILFTLEEDWNLAQQAQRSQFSAFINKSASLKEIVNAIALAATSPQRFAIYSSSMRSERKTLLTPLTATELEILNEIHSGATTAEIALRRRNSEATVKTHLTSIYRKLNVRNRVEAIAEGRRLRLI